MNERTKNLNQSIGAKANNNNGKFLGNVAGMIQNTTGEVLEYIVLKSNIFFGRGDRFFAIPAQSSLIRVTKQGKVIIYLKEDDLQFARGISADSCPEPSLINGFSVFELYNYDEDRPKAFTTHTLNQK